MGRMDFRQKLLRTLAAFQPVLKEPGVLIAGSEVPNLMETEAASTLVVSQDVDIAVPVSRLETVKERLRSVRGFQRSPREPSVWLPLDRDAIEVNFIGMDARGETYVYEDPELPLLVFGQLALLRPGRTLYLEGLTVPLPRPAGLLLEKLLSDRSGEKGDRDLLVALALLLVSGREDHEELETEYRRLRPDQQYGVRSALTILSLMEPRKHMPDPVPHRALIVSILRGLEGQEPEK